MFIRPLIPTSLVIAIAFFASGAWAATIHSTPHASETDLHDILSAHGYAHAGSIAELNANQSSAETFNPLGPLSSATLLIEDAGYRNDNELGIYSVSDPNQMATLFSGPTGAPASATVVFGAGGLESVNGASVGSGFGTEFGFYLRNTRQNFIWYSQVSLNTDGYDHFVAFEKDGVLWGGFEDLAGGGDQDFNDLAFRMRGVSSAAPVPEPSAALVFGAGLLVASRSIRRRRAA